jgi:hypothetical protein
LRKAPCRRLAGAGCSANKIAAISAHTRLREVERYTKAVDQEQIARNARARTRANIPARLIVKFPDVDNSGNLTVQHIKKGFRVATPAGFEPATFSLEGCCSIP